MANTNNGTDATQLYASADKAIEGGTESREKVELRSGRGDSRRTISSLFTGFNHRMAPLYVPRNAERCGYTFYTRPDYNFSEDNIGVSRRLTEALRGGYESQAVAIMSMLDPTNALFSYNKNIAKLGAPLRSGIGADPKQAFIPFLSTLQLSLTGFPDSTLDVYTSEEGLFREQIAMVDSTYLVNNVFPLNATFRNVEGDPITTYLVFALEYMAAVKAGDMIAKWSNIYRKRIDYQHRIYRFIMDPTNRYIRKYGIANAVFPVNDSLGASMNISANEIFVNSNDTIDVQFQAQGAYYMDPVILEDFNRVVRRFNPDMQPANWDAITYVPRGDLVKLSPSELVMFNWMGYPQIDLNTYELNWYVPQAKYDEVYGRT